MSGSPGRTQTDPHPRVLPQAGPRGCFLVLALETLPPTPPPTALHRIGLRLCCERALCPLGRRCDSSKCRLLSSSAWLLRQPFLLPAIVRQVPGRGRGGVQGVLFPSAAAYASTMPHATPLLGRCPELEGLPALGGARGHVRRGSLKVTEPGRARQGAASHSQSQSSLRDDTKGGHRCPLPAPLTFGLSVTQHVLCTSCMPGTILGAERQR